MQRVEVKYFMAFHYGTAANFHMCIRQCSCTFLPRSLVLSLCVPMYFTDKIIVCISPRKLYRFLLTLFSMHSLTFDVESRSTKCPLYWCRYALFHIDLRNPEKWNDLLKWSQRKTFEKIHKPQCLRTSQNLAKTFHWHRIFCTYFSFCQRSSLLSFKISIEFEWNLHEISSVSFFHLFFSCVCFSPSGVYVQHLLF